MAARRMESNGHRAAEPPRTLLILYSVWSHMRMVPVLMFRGPWLPSYGRHGSRPSGERCRLPTDDFEPDACCENNIRCQRL